MYKPFLKPRLEALRDERGLNESQSLPVDLCMLSHIDDDHVVGLVGLTKELVDADEDNKPKLVQILDLWHNSFDDIVDNDAAELAGAVEARFGPASLSGDLPPDAGANVDSVMVLAGIPRGRRLRDDAEKLGIERNLETEGALVMASADSEPIDMGKGLTFTVVGPMLEEVKALQREHAKWVDDHPDEVRKSADGLASYDDDSVPNLSSIVVLAEAGERRTARRCCFTGDARGDKILQGLELVGLVERGRLAARRRAEVSAPRQHRQRRAGFLRARSPPTTTCSPETASTATRTGRPSNCWSPPGGTTTTRSTSPIPLDEMDVERKKHWESHQDEPWSDATHSLAAFLADNDNVVIVEEGVPHTIDLLGER